MQIQEIIEAIESELAALKSEAEELVTVATDLLRKFKPEKIEALNKRPKRLWVRIKAMPGYPTFSIVWAQVIHFHVKDGRLFTRDLTRGDRFKLPYGRFHNCARGYPVDVQEALWTCEERFAKIRKKVANLSRSREQLLQYLKE